MDSLTALAQACTKVGAAVPHWTQGAGGNLSLKENGALYIKASGLRLDAVTTAKGVSSVDHQKLVDSLSQCRSEEDYSLAIADSNAKGSPRPSMEAGFHALLSSRWVFHFHSLAAVLMSHEWQRQPGHFEKWTKGKLPLKVLPAILPGLELSRAFSPQDKETVFLLQNHGVVLQGDSTEVLAQWSAMENSFLKEWHYPTLKAKGKEISPCPLRLYFPDSAVFLERLTALQSPDGELADDCWSRDRDMAEIWQATSLLYHAQPDLAELPHEISSRVSGLPTERFRKAAGV